MKPPSFAYHRPGSVHEAVETLAALGPDAKVLAVPARDPRYADLRDLGDVPGHLLDEIGHFFDIYKELEPGKGTDVRSWQDRACAEKVISEAWARARTR